MLHSRGRVDLFSHMYTVKAESNISLITTEHRVSFTFDKEAVAQMQDSHEMKSGST